MLCVAPLLLLALTGTPGVHAQWTEVEGEPGLRKFVELDSLQRRGDLLRVREMMEFDVPITFSGERVLSIQWVNEYQCKKSTTRVVSYVGFADRMGRGSVKVAGDEPVSWAVVPMGSLASKVLAYLCHF